MRKLVPAMLRLLFYGCMVYNVSVIFMALQLLASVSMAATRMQLGKEKDSMFADIAKVFIKSGKGGNGHVSFRRELYVPAGGPDWR